MTDPENYLNPPEAAQEESRYETLAVKRGPKLTATMERLHREAELKKRGDGDALYDRMFSQSDKSNER